MKRFFMLISLVASLLIVTQVSISQASSDLSLAAYHQVNLNEHSLLKVNVIRSGELNVGQEACSEFGRVKIRFTKYESSKVLAKDVYCKPISIYLKAFMVSKQGGDTKLKWHILPLQFKAMQHSEELEGLGDRGAIQIIPTLNQRVIGVLPQVCAQKNKAFYNSDQNSPCALENLDLEKVGQYYSHGDILIAKGILESDFSWDGISTAETFEIKIGEPITIYENYDHCTNKRQIEESSFFCPEDLDNPEQCLENAWEKFLSNDWLRYWIPKKALANNPLLFTMPKLTIAFSHTDGEVGVNCVNP